MKACANCDVSHTFMCRHAQPECPICGERGLAIEPICQTFAAYCDEHDPRVAIDG